MWNPFKKSVEIRVVEVLKGNRLTPHSPEDREAIAALNTHPGFLKLIERLNFQQTLLKEKIASERQGTTVETDFIQSGIFWTGWLQAQVARETNRPNKPAEALNSSEKDALAHIRMATQTVGQ